MFWNKHPRSLPKSDVSQCFPCLCPHVTFLTSSPPAGRAHLLTTSDCPAQMACCFLLPWGPSPLPPHQLKCYLGSEDRRPRKELESPSWAQVADSGESQLASLCQTEGTMGWEGRKEAFSRVSPGTKGPPPWGAGRWRGTLRAARLTGSAPPALFCNDDTSAP